MELTASICIIDSILAQVQILCWLLLIMNIWAIYHSSRAKGYDCVCLFKTSATTEKILKLDQILDLVHFWISLE